MIAAIIVTMIFVAAFATIAFLLYRKSLRRAKNIERGLKMVPLLIHLPPPSEDTSANMQGGGSMRDVREIAKESVSQGFCDACFTRKYPVVVNHDQEARQMRLFQAMEMPPGGGRS